MRILMDLIKDYLEPIIVRQNTAKNIYDALKKLYDNENPSRILALKDQIRQVKFTKNDSVSSYFLEITYIKYRLALVNGSVPNRDLILTCMGGISSEWKPFVKGICAHGQLPTFNQFWSKSIQEETREFAST